MSIHFEELWEKCENIHQDTNIEVSNIIDELLLKVNLYKAIATKTEIPPEERQKMQSRTLGEILLTLTHLSLKDNINVYEALFMALQFHSVEKFSKKYP